MRQVSADICVPAFSSLLRRQGAARVMSQFLSWHYPCPNNNANIGPVTEILKPGSEKYSQLLWRNFSSLLCRQRAARVMSQSHLHITLAQMTTPTSLLLQKC